MVEKRLSAQEVLERRKKAKEAGTYNGASSSSESRNAQEVLERRNRAKEAGTYKAYEPKKVQSVAPSITNEQAKALTNQKTTGSAIRKYKEQQQDRYGTSDSRFEGLTNPTYQNYLDNIQIHATEQKHFDWLKEQASNLESMKRYPEIAEAVKAYHTARWNPLEYMQKYDAENVLKKYGYDEEGIKSLVDTYNRERNALASAGMKERADELTDSRLLGKVVAKLEGFGANMASIFAVPQGWTNALNEKITGEYNPLDTNSAFHALGEYRDRIEQNITEDIEGTGNGGATLREALHKDQKDTPAHRKALGDVYQAASSVANNLATAGAFGQAGALAVMGSQAAQSSINDTFKRTGDNTKSALTGTAAGLIEAGTEKLSLDHLWDIAKGTGKTLTRSTLVNLIAQSGIEGTEEMTSEALNTLVDRLINQQDSNYELNVQNYINQGYSEEEARDKAFNDFKGQVKEAGTIGALAGGIGGGVAVAANKLGQHSTGADAVQTGQMEQIVAQAQTYNDKRVQKALKEYQEKPSDMKAGKLMYEMYTVDEIARNQAEKKDKGNLLQRITKNRKEGQNSQPHNVAEENQTQSVEQKPRIDVENAITRMSEAQNAEELSDVMHEVEDNGTQEQIQEARSYYEMRGAQMVVEGKTTNEELAFTGMQMSEAKAYEAGSKNEAVAPEKLSLKGKIAYNEGQQSYIKELARKNIISNTEEVVGAKATDNTGKELVIQDIVLEEREPSVRTSNGTVNLKDISFQNEAVGILYNNASTLGSTKAAQAYVKNYPGNIMVNGYHDIVQSILKDGELGLDINKVLKRRTGATYWIGEEGVKEFYALGQERAKESNRQLETVKRKGKGQLMDKRRGKTEEPLMKVLEQIAERTGLDIEVSDKEVSEVRGYFEESMSRIVLNADANMFETVFHELGEFTDSWNTEGMQKFQTALLDWYFETHDNDKMQNLIESVQNIYKQQEGSKTYREAANEIVNDAISGLFATETGAKDFAEWLAKNRTETETKSILQTITDFLKDLCGAIRKYIAGHSLTATTRTTMEVGEERAKELRQQFLEAMDKAVMNYQQAENTKEKNTTKRFSFAGLDALTADNDVRIKAYWMEQEGKSESDIFKETGWFRGADGKWRFEIDDSEAKIYRYGDAELLKKPIYKEYQELSKDLFEGFIDEKGYERLKIITPDAKTIRESKKIKTVSDYMEHPKLYDAYPFLATIPVVQKEMKETTRGSFSVTEGIEINKEYFGEYREKVLKKILLHELQHAIQHYERFAGGANTETWSDVKIKKNQKKMDEAVKRRMEAFNGGTEEFKNLIRKLNRMQSDQDFGEEYTRVENELFEKYEERYREYDEAQFEVRLYMDSDYLGDGEKYLMTAGEIEAREVADRADWGAEIRKEKMPKRETENGVIFSENPWSPFEYKERRYSLNDSIKQAEKLFAEEYDAWDKINPTKVFKVSVASKALKEIGIDDKSITMDSSKIIKIRSKHNGMTDAVIKKIPRVINEPMLILESKNTPSRVVMLGELVDEDGKTVLVVLELNPTNRKGIALDEIKIASAYGKDNLQKFVNASKILYVHPDNTKTSSWLTSTRLQLPVESLTTGSTDSIPSTNSVVNNDLRYSLNDATNLSDFWFNNDNLEEPIRNAASILEEGAKLLQGKEVDTTTIRKIARGMVNEYHSHYNVDTLSENLEKLFSYMQSLDKVSYDDMIRIMTEVTMPVIEESTSIDETQQEIYKTFKKNLRNMSIKLSAQQKQEVAHYYDSYENFRRKMFGTLNLSKSGQELESLWFEISQMSNGFIDWDVTETDQPLRLVEALEQMKPQVVNNFGADNHGVAMDMALRIYEEYFKAQHSAKVRSLEIQMRKDRTEWQRNERLRYDNNLREMRIRMRDKQEKFDERVLKMRAQYRTSELQRKYDQEAAEYRYKIKKDGNELVRWIEHPTHQKHVPKELKGMVLEFLDCIDFISHRAKEDSKTTLQWRAKMLAIQKELEVTNLHMEAGTAEDSQLKNFLQTLNPDFLPTLDKFLNDSERVEKISQMGYSQLKELEFLVRTMKTAVVKANELHANKLYRYAADAGTETLRELNARTKRKAESKITQVTGKALSLDMAEPKTYFERLGKGATSIYKEFRKGMDKRIFLIREARQYMEEILKDVNSEELNTWVGDKATVHAVQAKEGKIQLTTGQIMSLYLLSKRNQGRVHILQGGIRATEVGEGKNKIVQNKEVHLSQEQLMKILNLLTPEQKALADKMQKFLADNCAKWGNEVHMQMYEYEMFNDERYFPIRTVEGQRNDKGKQDDTGNAYAVKNLGFTKSIQKKAPQAIWAEDVMEAFVNHTVNMATYNAYLIPLADAMKWFNFNNAGFEGEHFELDSVHGVIEEVYGKQANTYFKELLYEINGREKRDSKAELMKVLTRNMKKASVMGSLSVMVQQPTAYVRALNVLNAKDLLGALNSLSSLKKMKENAEEAIQYSAIAQWKDWGFFEAYMGKSMQQVITGQRTTMEKIEDFASAGAQKADKYTWGVLWNACKKEIARTRKDLEVGSKEFFEVVTERFDEVIDETQVVDSILHKCPALKSDGIISMEMAFMNEPIKSYNMLYRAADHLAREETTGPKKVQKAFLNKKFGRAATAYLLSNLLTSMAASLVYALRDDKEEPFGQRYWNWLTDTALDNLNPLSMIPIAKSVISLLQGYEVERMDMQGISTVISAVQATQKKITQPDKSTQTWYGVAKKFARGLSTLHGDPFYNVWRDAEAIFEEMAGMNVPEKETIGNLYEDLIWSEPGSKVYERAYKKLQNTKGKTKEDIKKGIRSKLNAMFKEGELTEEEAKDALRRFGYTDVSDIVKKWKENIEK